MKLYPASRNNTFFSFNKIKTNRSSSPIESPNTLVKPNTIKNFEHEYLNV